MNLKIEIVKFARDRKERRILFSLRVNTTIYVFDFQRPLASIRFRGKEIDCRSTIKFSEATENLTLRSQRDKTKFWLLFVLDDKKSIVEVPLNFQKLPGT